MTSSSLLSSIDFKTVLDDRAAASHPPGIQASRVRAWPWNSLKNHSIISSFCAEVRL